MGYPLKRTKRRKIDFVLKNCCEISRDNNHQSLYKSIKLYNDIELDPGRVTLIITDKSLPSTATSREGLLSHKKITLARLVCLCFSNADDSLDVSRCKLQSVNKTVNPDASAGDKSV